MRWILPIGIVAICIVFMALCGCASLPKGHVLAPPMWCTQDRGTILCVFWTGGQCYAYGCPEGRTKCSLLTVGDTPDFCEPEWAQPEWAQQEARP